MAAKLNNATLDAAGVIVQQNACPKDAIQVCHDELLSHLSKMLTLPRTLEEGNRVTGKNFLMFSLRKKFKRPDREPDHRRDYKLPIIPSVMTVLKHVLSGGVGDVLASTVGENAELCDMSAIVSEPGASGQAVHSDAEWIVNSPRLVTIFLVLQDILEEELGPTRFVSKTHTPDCFADGTWLPPTEARVVERGGFIWFKLSAGDCIVMDSTIWHARGENSSKHRKRALLSVSFIASSAAGKEGNDDAWLLADFRK